MGSGDLDWPIESRLDQHLRETWAAAAQSCGADLVPPDYGGKRTAVLLTHDIDSETDSASLESVLEIEKLHAVCAAIGFVPAITWPTEEFARSLVADGHEVYWHDIRHDARLPYSDGESITNEFDRTLDGSPWARDVMRTFRSGQLLMSRALHREVRLRFDVDMSFPDTEMHGPYGQTAGCGTVYPFWIGTTLELPVTLPQDVYLRHVHRLSPDEMLDLWTKKLEYIIEAGGIATLAVHPGWVGPRRSEMQRAFATFIERVANDDRVLITTPLGVARLFPGRDSTMPAPENVGT